MGNLVVEDDGWHRRLWFRALSAEGYAGDPAPSGGIGIASLLKNDRPDTLLGLLPAIDLRDDFCTPTRIEVYHGEGDRQFGVGRLVVPKHVPLDALADSTEPQAGGQA